MTDLTARLEVKVTPAARRRLRMFAAVEDKTISAALDAVLLTRLPSADEMAEQCKGQEAVPA